MQTSKSQNTVNTKQEIYTLLSNNKAALQELGVLKLGLFGSFIDNSQTKTSDVDLLVEFDKNKKTFRNFINTANFAEKLLGRNVDLITKESLSPHIGPHIMREIQYVQIA